MTLTFNRSAGESILVESRVFPLVPHNSGLKDVPEDGLLGFCTVCGCSASFIGFTENVRESGSCSNCGSFNRQRQLATIIRAVHGIDENGPLHLGDETSVFNTESKGVLHAALSKSKRYTCSEYFGPRVAPGELVDGVLNQDLQELTFDDGVFNLVVTTEVLEHMPRPYDAHKEIFRVLKHGGRHIFTVPFYPWEALDQVRAVERDGAIEYIFEPMYHEDPVKPEDGILVWNIFGLQMIVDLERMGFKVSCWNLHSPENGIIGPFSIVFAAVKP